jgi:hypothetical protein
MIYSFLVNPHLPRVEIILPFKNTICILFNPNASRDVFYPSIP